jgi:hypothetical protein
MFAQSPALVTHLIDDEDPEMHQLTLEYRIQVAEHDLQMCLAIATRNNDR